jgi:hypothetical protein
MKTLLQQVLMLEIKQASLKDILYIIKGEKQEQTPIQIH